MAKAIVVGAGLSGLTAAWRLQQAGWSVHVLEAGSSVGGRVQSVSRDGYTVDTGATGIMSSYHEYLALLREVGLGDLLTEANPSVGVMRDGTVHELDSLHVLRSGLASRLLSWRAKLQLWRVFYDVHQASRKGWLNYSDMACSAPLDTESSRDYANRRLGPELRDYFCDPMTRVMLLVDPADVSRVELFSALNNIFDTRIYGLLGGLTRLPTELASRLSIGFDSTVSEVREENGSVTVSFRDPAGALQSDRVDACVVSCPLPAAVAMCAGQADLLGPLNEQIEYTCAITVAVAFDRRPACQSMVVQIPSKECEEIAILFQEHNKVAADCPEGHSLIMADWEFNASKKLMAAPDETLVERSVSLMRRAFPEIGPASILFSEVTRWPRALPLTRPGVYQAIAEFNAALDPASRIQFAADYMGAAGQNTAVAFGNRAAANLISSFG